MKKAILFILLLGAISSTCRATKYKVMSNIDGIISMNDYEINMNINLFLNENIEKLLSSEKTYKAPIQTIVKLVESNFEYKNTKYVVVEIDSVPQIGDDIVKKGNIYLIPQEKFDSPRIRFHSGFDHGGLTVPYKLRFNETTISPSATLGYYIGHKVSTGINWYTSFIGTFGLTGIALNDVNSENVDNVLGISYGGGIIFNYDNKIQFGAIVGADIIGGDKGKDWKYENKPWVSIAIGFTFLRK